MIYILFMNDRFHTAHKTQNAAQNLMQYLITKYPETKWNLGVTELHDENPKPPS